jgi:hypothetical protein
MKIKSIVSIAVVALVAASLAGCTSSSTDHRQQQLQDNQSKFDGRTPPKVTGDTEYNNYIKAQEDVYDDPSNILWCTAAFPSATSPIFTVPIAGKLTSSTVSYYPSQGYQRYLMPSDKEDADDGAPTYDVAMGENQSVDGMYHGTAVPYRYGFTPGGQYVDFTGLAVFCTTALTEFQRQSLEISTSTGDDVTKKAEAELKAGDKQAAQDTVDGAGK